MSIIRETKEWKEQILQATAQRCHGDTNCVGATVGNKVKNAHWLYKSFYQIKVFEPFNLKLIAPCQVTRVCCLKGKRSNRRRTIKEYIQKLIHECTIWDRFEIPFTKECTLY
jgi:hypothetical protein